MGQNPVALAAVGVESECWARAAMAMAQRGVSLRSRLASHSLDLDDGSGWKAEAGPALCSGGCGRPGHQADREADLVWVLCSLCFSWG